MGTDRSFGTEIRWYLKLGRDTNLSGGVGFCLFCFKMGEIAAHGMFDVDGNDPVERGKRITKEGWETCWRDAGVEKDGWDLK